MYDQLTILIFVLFAHYVADFSLQNPFMAEYKSKFWYVMVAHCMVYTGVICATLLFFGIFALWMVPFLFIGHFVMDEWKCHHANVPENWWMIYPDQAWHIIQLIFVVFVVIV